MKKFRGPRGVIIAYIPWGIRVRTSGNRLLLIKKIYAENMKKIAGAIWELSAK
jgi:hypothetical protein